MRKLCINELKFEPMQIKVETFDLSVIDADDKKEIINNYPFDMIYNYQTISLTRTPRQAKLS